MVGAVVCAGLVNPLWAGADDNQWGFGSDLSFTSGTVNGTVFTLGFNLDYYINRNFCVGPMMQISPMGDLFQIAFASEGRYQLRFTNGVNLVPFFGFGLIHADLGCGSGPGSIDRNDTSWYVPVDLSVEHQVVHNMALTSTLQVNLYNINLSPSLSENDRSSVTLLFGFRWDP